MKKIAFCFLTYGDIHQGELWQSFFSGHEEKFSILVHNKLAVQNPFFAQHIIDDVIETRYGTITQLKASIKLFDTAFQNPENDYFILVSGSCLPLHSFDFIYDKVCDLDSTLYKVMAPQLGRLKFMKDQTVFNKNTFKAQSTWMVMKRGDYPTFRDNDMTDTVFGNRVFGVDHHYFLNLSDMFQLPYKEFNVTWDNWDEPDVRKNPYHYGPKTYEDLDDATIEEATSDGSLFIRKIAENCTVSPRLVERIKAL